MRFYRLSPEVAGGWGRNTVADTAKHPPVVHHLHYQFDGWQGDDLLESFPCFIVTQRLAECLRGTSLNGFELRPVETTKSDLFCDLYGDRELPSFKWLHVTGSAGIDDLGLEEGTLVVSQQALDFLAKFSLVKCDVKERSS